MPSVLDVKRTNKAQLERNVLGLALTLGKSSPFLPAAGEQSEHQSRNHKKQQQADDGGYADDGCEIGDFVVSASGIPSAPKRRKIDEISSLHGCQSIREGELLCCCYWAPER